jgi:predicted nuclease of restriction endonuclease-like (RecB) superfamily
MFFETLWIENFAKRIEEKIMRKFFRNDTKFRKNKEQIKSLFCRRDLESRERKGKNEERQRDPPTCIAGER